MAKKFVAKCARKHNTCRLFPQMVSIFPATVTTNSGRRVCHTTPERTQITWISRPMVDQEKSATDVVARTKVGLFCTRRSWVRSTVSILSLCSCYPTFKQQAVMAISAKSVDEVRSWVTDNGFGADTFEYASKLYGKWISTKVNCFV